MHFTLNFIFFSSLNLSLFISVVFFRDGVYCTMFHEAEIEFYLILVSQVIWLIRTYGFGCNQVALSSLFPVQMKQTGLWPAGRHTQVKWTRCLLRNWDMTATSDKDAHSSVTQVFFPPWRVLFTESGDGRVVFFQYCWLLHDMEILINIITWLLWLTLLHFPNVLW